MSDMGVRVLRLEPMRVASVRAIGPCPEEDAWRRLESWAEPRGLLENGERHPVYGFNNPDPAPDRDEYGYEFWIAVDADEEWEELGPETRAFEGGLYAVARCPVEGRPDRTIPRAWKRLAEWARDHGHTIGCHRWLERHLNPRETLDDLVLELCLPLES